MQMECNDDFSENSKSPLSSRVSRNSFGAGESRSYRVVHIGESPQMDLCASPREAGGMKNNSQQLMKSYSFYQKFSFYDSK